MASRNLTGTVEGVNERGVKINGEWLNFSKWFEGEREPSRGSSVTMVLDEYNDREFVKKLAVVAGAVRGPGGVLTENHEFYQRGGGSGTYVRSQETDKRIARQVALKAAVEYVETSPGEANISDVIEAARQFEAFLNEPFGEVDVEDAA